MEQEKQNAAARDAGKKVISPRFSESATHHARPVVRLDEVDSVPSPLSSRFRQAATELTSNRLALILVLVSMFASGVIGALATVLYQQHATPAPSVSTESPSSEQDVSGQDASTWNKDVTRQQTVPVAEADNPAPGSDDEMRASLQEYENHRSSLRTALDEWIATTNARDLNRQKEFYMPKVNAFYRARNVSRDEVLADKERAFGNSDLIDVRAGRPEITLHPGGRTATMRFRKQYAVRNGQRDRRGEVLQELRWQRTDKGWKIVSERDVKVIQ